MRSHAGAWERVKQAERRWLAQLFRSSGMDAAIAPSAYGRAVGAAEKELRQPPQLFNSAAN
ncbi:MAG: hypothetical protein ABW092_05695 [Candidatus Thiodiazotropha sp.]